MDIKATTYLMREQGNIKALVDVNLDDMFVVKGLKVMDGENGLFIAMPSKKVGKEYQDTFFPITAEAREKLIEASMASYENKLKQQEEQKSSKEQSGDGKKGQKKGKHESEKAAQTANEEEETEIAEDEQTEGPTMSM